MTISKFVNCIRDFTIFLFILGLVTAPVKCEDDDELLVVQAPNVTNDVQVICEAISAADEDIKVDVDGMMDYDDLLRLTVWTSKYDLRSGIKNFTFPEIDWKRPILARLGALFLKTCPTEYINEEFVNVVIELFMVYQNSLNMSHDHSRTWNPLLELLDKCILNAEKLTMVAAGFELTGVQLTVDGVTEEHTISPPEELADASQDLDIIIDAVWWLFSLSFGTCYWTSQKPNIYTAHYKQLFYATFMTGLGNRWLHAGSNTEFGLIFTDLPFRRILKNLRVCVTASYTKEAILDRQPVRSIPLAAPSLGIEAGLNKKISRNYMDSFSNIL